MRRAIELMLPALLAFVTAADADWRMSAHDPQRTSCSSETIAACSTLNWVKPMPPLIPSRSQIITYQGATSTEDKMFVTTSSGIFSLDPANGNTRWIYEMELPPGDSPTYDGGYLYICGVDKSIHCIDAETKAVRWQTDRAGGAFYCNPVVVNGKVYAGSRDGFLYCFDSSNGSFLWSYPDAGQTPLEPIAQSVAYNTYAQYPNGVIFFTAKDNRCYAVRADNGDLIWSSSQFSVDGFSAYWPVLVDDRVLLSGADNYPTNDSDLIIGHLKPAMYQTDAECQAHYLNGWLDLSNHVAHLTQYPSRKTFFVLDRTTGAEAEVSPVFDWGNPAGNRPPPAIGPNPAGGSPAKLVWASSAWHGGSWFTTGRFAGWQQGTALVRVLPQLLYNESADEPDIHVIIGSFLYYCAGGDGADRGGCMGLSGSGGSGWDRNTYGAGYNQHIINRKYFNIPSWSGVHGHQNPPVPLRGRVFFHRSNAVISMR